MGSNGASVYFVGLGTELCGRAETGRSETTGQVECVLSVCSDNLVEITEFLGCSQLARNGNCQRAGGTCYRGQAVERDAGRRCK